MSATLTHQLALPIMLWLGVFLVTILHLLSIRNRKRKRLEKIQKSLQGITVEIVVSGPDHLAPLAQSAVYAAFIFRGATVLNSAAVQRSKESDAQNARQPASQTQTDNARAHLRFSGAISSRKRIIWFTPGEEMVFHFIIDNAANESISSRLFSAPDEPLVPIIQRLAEDAVSTLDQRSSIWEHIDP